MFPEHQISISERFLKNREKLKTVKMANEISDFAQVQFNKCNYK